MKILKTTAFVAAMGLLAGGCAGFRVNQVAQNTLDRFDRQERLTRAEGRNAQAQAWTTAKATYEAGTLGRDLEKVFLSNDSGAWTLKELLVKIDDESGLFREPVRDPLNVNEVPAQEIYGIFTQAEQPAVRQGVQELLDLGVIVLTVDKPGSLSMTALGKYALSL